MKVEVTYFSTCTNLDELKSEYKRLVKKYHPDLGGDTRIMQDINAAHDAIFVILKEKHNAAAANPENKMHKTTETPEEFRIIVEKLIHICDIDIELCGSWL